MTQLHTANLNSPKNMEHVTYYKKSIKSYIKPCYKSRVNNQN